MPFFEPFEFRKHHHHHHHDHHEGRGRDGDGDRDCSPGPGGGRGRGGPHGGRGGWGGGGWGGGGWGGGFGGGHGHPLHDFMRMWRGGGRRARRGDVRGAILVVLADQPRNGYQIIQELAQRSGGAWRPSSGSIYPTLQQLEDEGLVDGEKAEAGGKLFKLTAAGKRYVEKNKAELEAQFAEAQGSEDDPRAELFSLVGGAAAALAQVAQVGTPAQLAEAKKLVQELRRKLYAMLAEAPEGDDADE